VRSHVALALFCVCLAAYGYFVYRGAHHNPDSRLALTYAVVERGALDIAADAAGTLDRALVGGHAYTDKAPGLSFLLVPLYAGLRLVLPATLLGPEDRFLARYLLTFFGLGIPGALFAAYLFTWLGRLEGRIGPRLAVAAGYALGSPVYPFTVSAFGHVPAGMCLFGAFAALYRSPEERDPAGRPGPAGRRVVLAGLLLGLAVAIEYPAAPAAAVVAGYGLWRGRSLPRLLAGALPPLLLLAAYHQAVFGLPWGVGYAHLDPGTGYAAGQAGAFFGVGLPAPGVALALLAGVRRGLLVHAPWLFLALPGAVLLWRRQRPVAAVALGVSGAFLAINSGYVFWDGGASWGPRHLVPALPFLALLALPGAARWPRPAWLLVAVSVLLTLGAVATRTLPDPEVRVPLRDVLLPRVLEGAVTNNWGQLAGLGAWRGVVPLLAAVLLLGAWAAGWRRSAGWLVAGLWALLAGATLQRAYLEYSEGYYLYLGARLAAGARLYADAASTQPPLVPLVVSLLWRAAPDVYLPRLLAISLYLLAALLAGRLARDLSGDRRVGVAATVLAAFLPLGAGTVQVLDANSVLAPLGPALVLLARRRPFFAGLVAAAGLAAKLTFVPLALAPLAPLLVESPKSEVRSREHSRFDRRSGLAYLAGLGVAGGLQLALWLGVSGRPALDGLFGELESPLLPFGAVLALVQLILLEGPVLALAAWGWWRARPGRGAPDPADAGGAWARVAWWSGLGAAVMPLLAIHQGTFVGVVRPAEPFFAVYAALALPVLANRLSRSRAGVRGRARLFPRAPGSGLRTADLGLALVLALPLWHDLRALTSRPAVDPRPVLARLATSGPPDEVLAPPYYAALAGRRMLYDYPDWTVWGMRAAAGVPHERELSRRLLAALEGGDLPLVAADFRLAYLPGVPETLARRYVRAGDDGDDPADRSVAFFVPR
jgi:hypothetical protein